MPRCFVERCHNYGGKRLNIILHSFPNNLDKIKTWLRCIEESGHVIRDIEELAERIFEGKTNNRFRVCSEHFTEQSYQPSGLRKTLRKDAIPTIFRDVPPQKCPWQKAKPTPKSTYMDSPSSGEANLRTLTSYQPNRPDHHRCGRVHKETNIKATEYFQQNTKETREVCSFGTKKPDFTHVILKLTLEIISLLTGEDYIVVKKTSSHGEGWSRTQSPITEPPPDSWIRAKNNDRKILELTSKIIELLTGEKCEYLEDNRMESHQALSSLDDMVNGLSDHTSVRIARKSFPCEEKEEIHRDQRQPYQFSNIKLEAVSYDERNITDPKTYTCTDNSQHYSSTPVKEEPVSRNEANFPDSEIHAATDHTQHHTSPHIKEEQVSCDSRIFKDPDIYTLTDHEQQPPSLIKEEPVTYEGGHLTESNNDTTTDHVHHNSASMEQPSSCDEGKLASPTDYAQHHPSHHVISESVLYDKAMARNTDMYAEAQPSSTHADCENEDAQNKYSLFDKGNLDTDIYALIKHAQAKYTFTRIEDGSSSEEENSKDLDPHTPADHTQQRPPGEAVPQTFQCPDCSECFTRKSGLLNHRRNHRQEKLTCSKCGKVFSKRSSLQNHLTLHTGEKPFACPVCGKCFARKSNLISHETIHSGKASFICAECGRYFVCKVHLTKHQIIHEK